MDDAPITEEKVPDGQNSQLEGLLLPVFGLYVPAMHDKQFDKLVAPTVVEYRPTGQTLQAVEELDAIVSP